MTSEMPYKMHISEINALPYLQRIVMLKFPTITMSAMIMLTLLQKVPTTTESRICIVCKTLSTRSNTCMKKSKRMCMFGVTDGVAI